MLLLSKDSCYLKSSDASQNNINIKLTDVTVKSINGYVFTIGIPLSVIPNGVDQGCIGYANVSSSQISIHIIQFFKYSSGMTYDYISGDAIVYYIPYKDE